MKYFKLIWLSMIVLTVMIRSYGYEPSYIKREIIEETPNSVMEHQIIVLMVYDPIDEVYYNLDDFNQLSMEQLMHFKGIGEVTAGSIIDHIRKYGALDSFYELTEIKGIGDKKLERILENSK